MPITCLLLVHFETWRVISAASSTNLVPSSTCHLVLCPRTDSLKFNPLTSKEVLELLKNLKPSKSPGPDQIRPSELKMVAKEIAWSVSILFNETLVTGELPQEFKMGNIVPLLKPGKTNTALPSNYRGITLTCKLILSKVLERIVYDQITTYLRERNILSGSQYGFRTGHSCADLLTVAIDDWLLAQDSKMHTAIVFIDLSKAFDNVQHQLLLLKLQQHGIGGSALAWFWSYLYQHSQNVMLNGSSSEYFYSSKGVPQAASLDRYSLTSMWQDFHQLLSNIMHHCHHLPMICHYIVNEKLKKKRAETPVKPWTLSRCHCRRLD